MHGLKSERDVLLDTYIYVLSTNPVIGKTNSGSNLYSKYANMFLQSYLAVDVDSCVLEDATSLL